LASLALVATGWGLALRYYAIRHGAFDAIGRYTVTQAGFKVIAQAALAFLGPTGLLWGEVIGRVSSLGTLWKAARRPNSNWFSVQIIRRYRMYPLVQLPSSVLDQVALMAPVPLFTAIYGVTEGG